MEDCLFCKIADGRIPGTIVYQGENVIAFKDLHPAAPYHILIIPIRHIASAVELTAEDGELLGELFEVAAALARDERLTEPERGYRMVTNIGPDAGQSVQHLHFHLLGGRPLGWPPG
jgi:histidine triad (HIT) family protein